MATDPPEKPPITPPSAPVTISHISGFSFFNVANCGDLAAEVEAVLSILPDPLRENLARGYAAFSAQDDISDDVNDELFEECDNIFYKHEQLIIDMIQEAANNGVIPPNHI